MITNPALLADIALRRFDRLPRLVYADWIEEQGDADAANTAEFIRVGVALAEMPQHHRAALECDCGRCRLVRHQTELFDAGAAVANTDLVQLTALGFDSVFQEVSHHTAGFVDFLSAGFKSKQILLGPDINRLAHAVGRAFLLMPIAAAAIRFNNRRLRGGHWSNWRVWQVDVAALTMPKDGSFRVSALVGPVSNGRPIPTFTCDYVANHVKRVPHLARKAVRRCLFNRHGSKEQRRTPPPQPLLPPQHPNCRSSVVVVRRDPA